MRCLSFARQSGFHPAALLHMFRLLSFHGRKFHIIISKLQEKSAKKRQQRRKKPFFPRIGSKIPALRQQTVPFLPPSLLPTGGERPADGTRTPPFAHTPEACTERARKRRRTHGQNGMPPAPRERARKPPRRFRQLREMRIFACAAKWRQKPPQRQKRPETTTPSTTAGGKTYDRNGNPERQVRQRHTAHHKRRQDASRAQRGLLPRTNAPAHGQAQALRAGSHKQRMDGARAKTNNQLTESQQKYNDARQQETLRGTGHRLSGHALPLPCPLARARVCPPRHAAFAGRLRLSARKGSRRAGTLALRMERAAEVPPRTARLHAPPAQPRGARSLQQAGHRRHRLPARRRGGLHHEPAMGSHAPQSLCRKGSRDSEPLGLHPRLGDDGRPQAADRHGRHLLPERGRDNTPHQPGVEKERPESLRADGDGRVVSRDTRLPAHLQRQLGCRHRADHAVHRHLHGAQGHIRESLQAPARWRYKRLHQELLHAQRPVPGERTRPNPHANGTGLPVRRLRGGLEARSRPVQRIQQPAGRRIRIHRPLHAGRGSALRTLPGLPGKGGVRQRNIAQRERQVRPHLRAGIPPLPRPLRAAHALHAESTGAQPHRGGKHLAPVVVHANERGLPRPVSRASSMCGRDTPRAKKSSPHPDISCRQPKPHTEKKKQPEQSKQML